jgi:D-alanyl-D-alanine carboxypeptidase (penicillin-binding protein 5/6)
MLLKFKYFIAISVFLVVCNLQLNISEAARKKSLTRTGGPVQTSLIVDGKTGKILHSHNQNVRVYPASLTKVMTLYMLFEALEAGKFALNDKLHVSPNATRAHPSKLHLKAGEQISVREAILALIVKSANDAAIVVAENIAGSEQKFAKLMNIRAKQLGMKNSFFTNASGWHHPAQKTTPIDLAKLSIAIKRDFPQYYGFFAKTSFKFKGKQINGHNRLTANYPGAEGLKTGFTNPAGCNLITVATRNGKTLVGVVTGSNKAIARDKKMASLLDKHFGIKNDNLKPKKAPKSRIKLASNKER